MKLIRRVFQAEKRVTVALKWEGKASVAEIYLPVWKQRDEKGDCSYRRDTGTCLGVYYM